VAQRKYYVFAGLVLVLYLGAFDNQARKSALPRDFDPTGVAYPAVVQGIVAGNEAQLRYIIEGWQPGDFVTIAPPEGPALQLQLHHADSLSYRITAFCSGAFFWLIAAFVLARRCDQKAPRYFFWMTLLYGLGIGLGGVYFNTQPWSLRTVFNLLQFGVLAFLPPIFIGLAQNFPRVLPVRRSLRRLMPFLWMVAAGLTLWQFTIYQLYFLQPGPERGSRLALPGQVADMFLVAEALAGIILLAVQLRGLQLDRERLQAKWMLMGFVVGATPYVFMRNLVQLLGMEAPLPHHVDRVFELAIPLAFGMAIARYRFLDIDIIIRRGLIYGLLAGVMTALFLVLGFAIGLVVPDLEGQMQGVHLLLTGVVGGLAFSYLRRGIGTLVDRTFFRINYNQERALAGLRHQLETISDRESLVRLLAEHVEQTLGSSPLGVALGEGADQRVAGDADPFQIRLWFNACREAGLGPNLLGRKDSTSMPEYEKDSFPSFLLDHGLVLIQPVVVGEEVQGYLMCGPRPTGRRYVQQDLNLLQAFAGEAADTLERIALVRAVISEGAERQRLDELNSLKNQFLAQVAHDLRTPLSSVTWSAANLRDGLVGELSEGQSRYIESIGSSAAHLNRLVDNLIEISQLDSGEIRFEPSQLDLATVVGEAVRTIIPVAETKDVQVVVKGSGAQIMANEDKLAVVLVNLLDNAVKYSPPGSRVEVGLDEVEAGRAGFTIRDQGPGFGQVQNLFRRFVQGEPSPYSQQRGFGLGLFIVKNYIDRLGGTVEIADHPEGGGLVRCTLPSG
jgi:signal transduction histidine kinase